MPEGDENPLYDPDLRHLLDLIALLPPPGRNDPFWRRIATHYRSHGETVEGATGYILEKISVHVSLLVAPHDPAAVPRDICDFAKYLAMFFGRRDDALWADLGAALADFSTDEAGALGCQWTDDVIHTAYTLLCRYTTNNSLNAWMRYT